MVIGSLLQAYFTMMFRLFRPVVLSLCLVLGLAGCAVFTKGRTQVVTIRSNPGGADVTIDGLYVGRTPVSVRLPRDKARSVTVSKAGFASQGAVLLTRPNEYEKRFLRWGIDYELGAMTELSPDDLVVDLKPEKLKISDGDRYAQMKAQVARADALMDAGTIGAADHRYLVEQITKFYAP